MKSYRQLRERRRISWPDLERVLQALPGWHREGRELHGPCPLCGGRRRCWARTGDSTHILFQCRKCGASFDDLLTAVGLRHRGDGAAPEPKTLRPRTAQSQAPDHLLGLWALGEPTDGSPGARYLTRRTGCMVTPPSIRWCRAAKWPKRKRIRPLPTDAAGALLYRFTSPSDRAVTVAALQVEAVNRAGSRSVPFDPAPNEDEPRKRPNVGGSLMTGRALLVLHGDRNGRTHVVEGPIDALAVVQLLGIEALRGAGDTVIGAPGTSGFSVEAVSSYPGPVTLWTDGDEGGYLAAIRLARALRRLGREVELRAAPEGQDWADVARDLAEEREEREAIRCD